MRYQVQENCLTIYLPREVDHHNADEIRKEADAVISRNHIRYVIFDFDRTDFMDSSGIGIIMGRYKTVSLIGGESMGGTYERKNPEDSYIFRSSKDYADL